MRLIFTLILLLASHVAFAQTTQPVALTSHAGLELRLDAALARNDFREALPIMQKWAADPKIDLVEKHELNRWIKECQAAATTQPVAATLPAAVERKPHPPPESGKVPEMSIKELGNFAFDPANGSPIPNDVKALDGTITKLRGYIIPIEYKDENSTHEDRGRDVTQFVLMPSVSDYALPWEGFDVILRQGEPPQLQHEVFVSCPKGKALTYYNGEVVVEGKLSVDTVRDDGFIVGIFAMETTSVKVAPK